MKGAWGEKAARLYLEKRGWHTAATNFRTRFGEIDIIAENAQYVIFAEVKTRKNARYGPACEAVTPAKQAKIIAAAQAWLQEHPTEKQPRFDVIEVYGEEGALAAAAHQPSGKRLWRVSMKLFDLHCDTIYECCETGKHLRENDLHINYAAAHRYRPYVQFFALFCGARQPYSPETRDCLLDTPADERFDRMLATARREFAANADWLTFCRSAADIRAAVEAGKAAALLSIEGAELLPDRPDALD